MSVRGKAVKIDPEKLLELVRDGYTNAQLAEAFGCTVRTIDRRRHDDPDLTVAIIAARAELAAANAPQHGTNARYVRGCRCRPCTDANTIRCREERLARRARHGQQPPDPSLGRPRTVAATVQPVRIISADPEILIGQAIARGETTSAIMQRLGCDYATVAAVRESLNEAAVA